MKLSTSSNIPHNLKKEQKYFNKNFLVSDQEYNKPQEDISTPKKTTADYFYYFHGQKSNHSFFDSNKNQNTLNYTSPSNMNYKINLPNFNFSSFNPPKKV